MNRLFTLLLFSISMFTLIAPAQSRESVVETLYYNRNVYITSEEERAKLTDLIVKMRTDSTIKVQVVGYSDRWGGKEVNDRFSYVRAMYIADWMRSCRVPREQITFIGKGIDTLAVNDKEARRVEILQVAEETVEPQRQKEETKEQTKEQTKERDTTYIKEARAAKPIEDVDVEMQVEPEMESQTPISSDKNKKRNNFALRTNLLYWACGMMNIGAEYKSPDSDFGFVLNGGYSLFGNTNWNHNLGGWFISPELRYYIPRNEQWFVGTQLLASGYNIKLSDTGSQGIVIGGGVMGGYKLPLTDSFDMDFTLGVGYGHFKYDTYYHDEATSTNPYIEKGVSKNSIMPIQAGVNLIWKIK